MIIRRIVCQRVAPSDNANHAERIRNTAQCFFGGTDDHRQCHNRECQAAARMLVPNLKKDHEQPQPKKPYTTEGIPARLMIAIRIERVHRVSAA